MADEDEPGESKPKRDYEVGYKKPPKATRFQPKQVANPKGRTRGARNLWSLIVEEADGTVTALVNGRERKLSKAEVIARKQVQRAMAGDHRAVQRVDAAYDRSEARAAERHTAKRLADEGDMATMRDFAQRAARYMGDAAARPWHDDVDSDAPTHGDQMEFSFS